jgi:hypothetical protein
VTETIQLGDIAITVTRKAVKHVHLSVHPPLGRVSLVAPMQTRPEVARAYVISKLAWIRQKQEQLRLQARELQREFVTRESHYLWGRRYLLNVVEADAKPAVQLSHRRITLSVRPGSDGIKREQIMYDWHKRLLHQALPALIAKWEGKLGVQVAAYFLQRMKTKWGGCNPGLRTIRLNTELVKKPKDLLDYVVLHEMAHLIEPNHSERFVALITQHYPTWRSARSELNELPLAAQVWAER